MTEFKYCVHCKNEPAVCFDTEADAMKFARECTDTCSCIKVEKSEIGEDGEILNNEVIWAADCDDVIEKEAVSDNEFDTEFPASDIENIDISDDVDYDEIAKQYKEYPTDWIDDSKLIKEAVDALEENESEVECKCCFDIFPKESCIKTEKGYICKKCNQELHSHQGTNLDLIDSDPFSLDYEDPRDFDEPEEIEVKDESVDANEVRKYEAGIEEKIEEHINDRPADIESDQEYQGVDNAVVDCKKYTVVAHSEDEKPVDCKLEKPALEEPLAGKKVDVKLNEDKKDDELPVDPEAAKLEVHTMLNDLVADEIEAINGYDDAKAQIIDTPIEHKDSILGTIDHIKEEEQEHIDELIDATTEIPFDKEEENHDLAAEEESLAEETHAQYAKPEGDRVAAYNNALKYAKKENKPFIYGYTNHAGKFFAAETPMKVKGSPADAEKEFRGRYKNCNAVYVVYPDKDFIDEKLEQPINEELKVIIDFSDYKPWSGAVDTYELIKDADKLDELEAYFEELYPDGITATQINDILWFDGEEVLKYLGLGDEEDEEIDEALTEDVLTEFTPIAQHPVLYKEIDKAYGNDGGFLITKRRKGKNESEAAKKTNSITDAIKFVKELAKNKDIAEIHLQIVKTSKDILIYKDGKETFNKIVEVGKNLQAENKTRVGGDAISDIDELRDTTKKDLEKLFAGIANDYREAEQEQIKEILQDYAKQLRACTTKDEITLLDAVNKAKTDIDNLKLKTKAEYEAEETTNKDASSEETVDKESNDATSTDNATSTTKIKTDAAAAALKNAYPNNDKQIRIVLSMLKKAKLTEDVDENLKEDKKVDKLPADPEAAKLEVHTMLNDLVADEIEAINGYDDAKAQIIDTPIEHKDNILDTIDHIKGEEQEHIDELIDATTEIPFDKEEETPAPEVEEPLNQDFPEVNEKLDKDSKLDYDTLKEIKSNIYNVIKKYWETVFSDEWFYEDSFSLEQNYYDEKLLFVKFKPRKEVYFKRESSFENFKADLKTIPGLKLKAIHKKLVNVNFYSSDDTRFIKVDEIVFKLIDKSLTETKAKPEGDKVKSYNDGLKLAKLHNKPVIYGYTNSSYGNKLFALDDPIVCDNVSDETKKFRRQYKSCNVVYVAYPNGQLIEHLLKEDIKFDADGNEIFTKEEQEEYDCDEYGNSNTSYDQFHHCGWCEEVYPEYDMRHEVDFGWICSRCEDELKSHGGPLTFIED